MARLVMPVPTREEMRRGIFYMIAAVFVFAVVNVLVKYEEATYPVTQVVFFRCAFSLIPCSVLIASHGGLRVLRTNRLLEHFGRGTLQFISTVFIFLAYHLMPLADAVAITFSAPIFLTILSIPMLGEQVGRHRWAAVAAGFLGILIMVPPGASVLSAGAALALGNAAISASVTIALRRMSLTEQSTTLVSYQTLVTTALSILLLPFGWMTPTWIDGLALAALGLCSGVGQFLWTQAFRYTPAAVCAPFSYTAMIWAIVFGYLVWGDVPTPLLLLGAALVAASGIYILYRETIRHRAKAPAPSPAPGGD